MMGPPPAVNLVNASIFSSGLTTMTASTSSAIVPIFMKELR